MTSGTVEIINNIKISVIIPMYNVEEYIEECIESVLNQKFSGIEIICVDDCSTDLTLKKIDKYMEKIILIKNSENKGLSYSRNKGFEEAKGEYVYFLDSDDMIKPGMFSFLYPYLVRNSLDAIFFSGENMNELEENKNSILVNFNQFRIHKTPECIMTGKQFIMKLIKYDELHWSVCLGVWKRKVLMELNIKFIEGIINEDLPWFFLNVSKLRRVRVLRKEFYLRRVRGNSITTTPLSEHSLESLLLGLYFLEKNFFQTDDKDLKSVLMEGVKIAVSIAKGNYRKMGSPRLKMDTVPNMSSEMKDFMQIRLQMIKQTSFVDELPKEVIKKIATFKNIYLYGAGNIASDCINILSRYNIFIQGVIVTNQDKNTKRIHCHDIIDLSSVEKENYIILITVKNHRENIEKTLIENGFNSFVYYKM